MASPCHRGRGRFASQDSVARATARLAQTRAFPSLLSCRAVSAAASSCSISAVGVILYFPMCRGESLVIVINCR
ncbi:MAG: hypothetical protein RL042_2365 [Nitrospirota bacterium]